MPLKLIIDNPPCSDSNRKDVSDDFSEIISLTNDFRPPTENRRERQNIQKQVNNPFMLFLRWSCEKLLNSNNHSILAFIVPLSFLEAESSYKYARKYLLKKFSKLWAIAIDADARTGIRGDSIFKTLQGCAVIILLRKFRDSSTVSEVNSLDISRNKRIVKEEILDRSIDETFHLFESFSVSDTMYSFMPTRPFNQELYSSFWPISSENNKPAIFLNQCSGAKMAPTALLTHVKKQMLKRRSKEIANDGIDKANEWIGGQDKKVVDDKIIAFQNALRTCSSGQQLEDILNENIIPCSFRPFVNSNALLWKRIFEYQAGVGGGGARIRPEIKAVYSIKDTTTVGFSLAHAPKDLDESLGQFASFCWYFPDNDLSRRGNGHIYLNQYIRDTKTNEVVTNINSNLLSKLNHMTGISPKELARKMVFYSYAIFCSQVYLEEFYGALFVVNQSESRARIPIVNDSDIFNKIAEIGERLAELEKNETNVDNILNLDYEGLLSQITPNFHLEHSKSASKSPYDEENELFLLRDELTGNVIEIYCPAVLQKFTVSGYNVIKDCWLKFHSYRFTHCNFTQTDFMELLDLFNKIALQMKIVAEIDEIMHNIVDGIIPLISYNDEK